MGVKKYTQLYKGVDGKTSSTPTNSPSEKQEIERLKKEISKKFEDPENIKKAARIIEQLLGN